EGYYYSEPAEPHIAAWLSHAPVVPDKGIYRAIARNLAGEMGYIREAEHYALYIQMLAGVGISLEEGQADTPVATTLRRAPRHRLLLPVVVRGGARRLRSRRRDAGARPSRRGPGDLRCP